ncbi:unnamed protein product [Macrosiphum euphorbiae]|uniref:Uncharacterized protein n=1 Tax=Macrosiphum euphorbiae TaxID=13131 RepID=A0AAV0WNN1_9HEMI|nr:unnamed protein product [Macrosiphum euphorbiae]
MEYNIANIFISFAIMYSVAVASGSTEKNKQTDSVRTQAILDRAYLRVCPPIGNSKFEAQTLQTTSLMFGCAYMESLQAYSPLFHLWLERPEKIFVHGNCDNMQNMDHFMFECLSKLSESLPTDQDEFETGWQYISLLEHTAESMENKTKTRTYRCALYAVDDQDYNMVRSIHMVISKPVIGEQFDVSQCNGLLEILARDQNKPNIPKGYRYWPDGSLYIYLLGRKTTIFVTNPSTTTTSRRPPTTTTTSRPSATTSQPSKAISQPSTATSWPSTTSSWPSTTTSRTSTTTTTKRPTTTVKTMTTEKPHHPSWFFFPNYYLYYI